VPYRHKKLTLAISSPDEFLFFTFRGLCWPWSNDVIMPRYVRYAVS